MGSRRPFVGTREIPRPAGDSAGLRDDAARDGRAMFPRLAKAARPFDCAQGGLWGTPCGSVNARVSECEAGE